MTDQSVWAVLEQQADRSPAAIACAFPGAELTYAELLESAESYAARLAGGGVRPGDVVAVLGRSCVEAWLVFLGLCRARGTYLGLNPSYTSAELGVLMADAKPRTLFALHRAADASQD